MERIESLSHPGAEETGQTHARRTALGAACPAADFARDDQRADTALREIVVSGNPGQANEDEEFGQEALNTFAEGMLGSRSLHKGTTKGQ